MPSKRKCIVSQEGQELLNAKKLKKDSDNAPWRYFKNEPESEESSEESEESGEESVEESGEETDQSSNKQQTPAQPRIPETKPQFRRQEAEPQLRSQRTQSHGQTCNKCRKHGLEMFMLGKKVGGTLIVKVYDSNVYCSN